MEALKPCPFCGGSETPHLYEEPLEDGAICKRWTLMCPECHARGAEYIAPSPDRDKLIASWNSRSIEDALQAKVDALVELVKALSRQEELNQHPRDGYSGFLTSFNASNHKNVVCEARTKCRALGLEV